MVENVDYVLAYVVLNSGGAAQSVQYAKKLGKNVINILAP